MNGISSLMSLRLILTSYSRVILDINGILFFLLGYFVFDSRTDHKVSQQKEKDSIDIQNYS
jgi:hypothetical protein